MPTSVTQLLLDWRAGSSAALDELMPLVYGELRRIARARLARERNDHTLQPTALVHEAYLRLVDHRRLEWQSSAHFFAIAATTMRRILVSHARKHHAAKRGGGAVTVSLREDAAGVDERSVELIALDEALGALAELDPRQSRIVELRYFAGLTIEETAEVLALSPATVKNEWKMARAWLFNQLLER